jgi:hypothetical protein
MNFFKVQGKSKNDQVGKKYELGNSVKTSDTEVVYLALQARQVKK